MTENKTTLNALFETIKNNWSNKDMSCEEWKELCEELYAERLGESWRQVLEDQFPAQNGIEISAELAEQITRLLQDYFRPYRVR